MPPLNLTIRPAGPEDYNSSVSGLNHWWGDRQMAAMLPRLFFVHFRPWTYVAERDGEIAGFLAAFQSQTDPRQVYCHFVGVDPAFRGQRIGEALYGRLFADAVVRGRGEVLAVTSPQNTGSIAFHTRLGFATLPGSEIANGVPYTPGYDGPGEDRVLFRKHLA